MVLPVGSEVPCRYGAPFGDGDADQHGDRTNCYPAGDLVCATQVPGVERFVGTRARERNLAGNDFFFFVMTWVRGSMPVSRER